ncbi:MAG: BON domain-containing protein [Verrucomicrobia bacterium]|nr:BON domain-containing protein [Verrucomicrobiota bacterium]
MKLNRLIPMFALAIGMATRAHAQAPAQELVIVKGSSISIPVPEGVQRITISKPSAIDATVAADGQSVVVMGKEADASELLIERRKGASVLYNVQVKADLETIINDLKGVLAKVEGLTIRGHANRVLLEGTLLTPDDQAKVEKWAAIYGGVVVNETKFDFNAQAEAIQDELKEAGLSGVKVKHRNGTLILEGTVMSELEKRRAEERTKLYIPKVLNQIEVREANIESDLTFVQVNGDRSSSYGNNVLKSLGVSGQTGVSGGGKGIPSITYGASASAAARINALTGNGSAKQILKQDLTAKSGHEATFMQGGNTSFQVTGQSGGDLKTVEYGLMLRIKPTLMGREEVETEVYIQVSAPNPKGGGAISLTKFETRTLVKTRLGESIVLSGLIQSIESQFSEKTPGLGSIPLLQLFFSEKGRRKDNSEMVVVITPKLISTATDSSQPFSEERRELLKQRP